MNFFFYQNEVVFNHHQHDLIQVAIDSKDDIQKIKKKKIQSLSIFLEALDEKTFLIL